ncbi:uncharacterized protein LOC143187284 isoform X1 [Calliopsis andreniformis]|uniref:uncharacterized protein LOC143187284 isoform X1 n=1 Tax=Calliopsis andreniformis TaxID=337506 RepID=UPI003FCE3AD5
MEKITHLWKVNQLVTKLNCSQSRNLQTFYIEKCRKLGKEVQLPARNFGPSVMCPYCGSLWNAVDHSIRISPGKPLSKSIKTIIHSMNTERSIPKVRRSLAQKCLKNKGNKLVLKCLVCFKSTKIPFNKPPREKLPKVDLGSIQSSQKRRKKRTKDKTAGLTMPGTTNSSREETTGKLKEISTKKVGNTSSFITPTQKLKKLNINRLKDVVNRGSTPQKRKSLHNFLTELC